MKYLNLNKKNIENVHVSERIEIIEKLKFSNLNVMYTVK